MSTSAAPATHPAVSVPAEEQQRLRDLVEKTFAAKTLEEQAEAWQEVVWGLLDVVRPVQTYTPFQIAANVGDRCPRHAMTVLNAMLDQWDFYSSVDQNVIGSYDEEEFSAGDYTCDTC